MGERYSKPVVQDKGLNRAKISDNKLEKAVKRLDIGSCATSQTPKISLLLSIAILRIHNLRLSDLHLSGTKFPWIERHSRFICLMILYLFTHGKASKTAMLMSFNLTTSKDRIKLYDLVDAGYIDKVAGESRAMLNGKIVCQQEEHLQLTSKGLDMANHIIELLTDSRLV